MGPRRTPGGTRPLIDIIVDQLERDEPFVIVFGDEHRTTTPNRLPNCRKKEGGE